MINSNAFIIVLTTFFIFCIFIIVRKEVYFSKFNKKLKNIQNIIALLGLILAALTIIITCAINIISNKNSNLTVAIKDAHGFDWEKSKPLVYIIDDNNHISYDITMPNTWVIYIKNTGNNIAENVTVDISFDNLMFIGQPDEYTLKNHLHGIGGYINISRTFDYIQPDSEVSLPIMPLESLEAQDFISNENAILDIKQTNIYITVYENNNITQSFSFLCKCDETSPDSCEHEKDEQKIKISNIDKIIDINNIYDYIDCQNIISLHPELSSSDFKIAYHYYLDRLNIYNPNKQSEAKKKAIFYGRLYYTSMHEDDIELKIYNDMFPYN